jgi:hypothetical protein
MEPHWLRLLVIFLLQLVTSKVAKKTRLALAYWFHKNFLQCEHRVEPALPTSPARLRPEFASICATYQPLKSLERTKKIFQLSPISQWVVTPLKEYLKFKENEKIFFVMV